MMGTTNLILWLISLVSISGYLVYTVIKNGISPSISKSTYRNKFEPLLSLALLLYAIPLAVIAQDLIITLSSVAICAVAVKTNFLGDDGEKGTEDDDRTNYDMHMIGSIGGVLLYLVGSAVSFGLWQIAVVAFVIIVLVYIKIIKIRNHIFWIEVSTIYLALIELLFLKLL